MTISGSNLTGATAVSFNGTPAPAYTVDSDSQITAKVPAGATSGPISVTTTGGTATSGGPFTVTTPEFSINATPAAQTVTAGGSTSYTITITPSGGFTVADTAGQDSGLQTVATFIDQAGAEDPQKDYSATIDWGDHQTSPGVITLNNHTTTVTLQIKKK